MDRGWPQGKRNRCIFADPKGGGSACSAATRGHERDCVHASSDGKRCFSATSARFRPVDRVRAMKMRAFWGGQHSRRLLSKAPRHPHRPHNPHRPLAARLRARRRRVRGTSAVMMTTHLPEVQPVAGRKALPQYKEGGRLARICPPGDSIGMPGASSRLRIGRRFPYCVRTEGD